MAYNSNRGGRPQRGGGRPQGGRGRSNGGFNRNSGRGGRFHNNDRDNERDERRTYNRDGERDERRTYNRDGERDERRTYNRDGERDERRGGARRGAHDERHEDARRGGGKPFGRGGKRTDRTQFKNNTHRDGGAYGNREGRESYGARQRRENEPNINDLWNEGIELGAGYEIENIDKRRGAKGQGTTRTMAQVTAAEQGLTRLNKYISNAGICSRREADELIAAGSVTVNGQVVTEMGYKVKPGDVVAYGGETLHSERKRYFLLNKPKGFITTVDDPQERQTVMMLIDSACPERLYPVGRLDRNTTGLLLFTNDGDMAKKLTHPSTGVYKIYHVELNKPVTHDDMRQMREGIVLEDGPIAVDDVQYVENANDKRIVGVELHSGKNRIVRRIFEHLGYDVHKLDRVVFAGLTKKDLPRGRYRELTDKEVNFLKMI